MGNYLVIPFIFKNRELNSTFVKNRRTKYRTYTPLVMSYSYISFSTGWVSLPQIMERLGHKDEDTTKDVYLNVTKEMKKEASQKFKELMENL